MAATFDEIGYWSEIKLEIVEQYAAAYTKAFSKNFDYIKPIYIDAFAGPGKHISKTTRKEVRGSPQIALDTRPPFKEFYFIDTDGDKIDELHRITAEYPEAHVIQKDCNIALLEDVFPHITFKEYKRALCLLDPYGLNLDWKVIEAAGTLGTIEIFINFPVMDMNRNVFLSDASKANDSDIARMDALWGDHTWSSIAYSQTTDLFGEIHDIKQNIHNVTRAFRKRLLDVAQFQYVPQPIPMRNTKSAILYFLFFASNNKTGDKILTNILNTHRNRGIR